MHIITQAKQWVKDDVFQSDETSSNTYFEEVIKAIQLDAFKAGMEKAADLYLYRGSNLSSQDIRKEAQAMTIDKL